MIERGAFDLKNVVNSSEKATEVEKNEAAELYKKILFTGFEWQRTGKVDEISRTENEEIRERLEEKEKLFITKAEFEDMIQTLGEQMKSAADAQEYHRASMIKDRMRELDEEMKKNELGGAGHKPGGDLMF
jgi:excinuclease UvrABC helicase subunit UvrB